MAKKKEEPINKEYNAKKDLFWKLFFINFFIAGALIMNLSQHSWYNPIYTVVIILIAFAVLIFGPGLLYPKVKEVYDVFQDKEYMTADNEEKKKKAKLVYNLFIFFGLFVVANPVANAIALFVFHKNKTADTILIILFSGLALFLSIYITEKKSKPPKNNNNGE